VKEKFHPSTPISVCIHTFSSYKVGGFVEKKIFDTTTHIVDEAVKSNGLYFYKYPRRSVGISDSATIWLCKVEQISYSYYATWPR
jgi:hypothetical protein